MFVGRFVVLGAYVSAITFMPMSIGGAGQEYQQITNKGQATGSTLLPTRLLVRLPERLHPTLKIGNKRLSGTAQAANTPGMCRKH